MKPYSSEDPLLSFWGMAGKCFEQCDQGMVQAKPYNSCILFNSAAFSPQCLDITTGKQLLLWKPFVTSMALSIKARLYSEPL